MQVVERLECDCNKGKLYASSKTFAKHKTSQRHINYERTKIERELRVKVANLEKEINTLEKEVESLKYFVNHPRRRNVSERVKKRCASQQGWRCKICAEILTETYQVDHVLPLWKNGSNNISNLQALCPNCHAKKTANDLE